MPRMKLIVEEKLRYNREIIVNVPDSMSEDELHEALDEAQQDGEYVSDFIYGLKRVGITLAEPYDEDMSSPDDCEIECSDYEEVEG